MKALLPLAILLGSTTILTADGAVCPRCEQIREYNKTHHRNYEYYDDYLKRKTEDQSDEKDGEQNEEKTSTPSAPAQNK